MVWWRGRAEGKRTSRQQTNNGDVENESDGDRRQTAATCTTENQGRRKEIGRGKSEQANKKKASQARLMGEVRKVNDLAKKHTRALLTRVLSLVLPLVNRQWRRINHDRAGPRVEGKYAGSVWKENNRLAASATRET